MYELNVNSRKQLERASLRAQAQKPKFEVVGYGMFKVFSSDPTTPWKSYSTGIEAAKDGNGYDVCCSCPTQRTYCKHVAAVFPFFLMTEKQQQTEPAPAGLVVQGVITTSMQELDRLIEQAIEESSDPNEYTEAQAARDRADLFGI